MIEVTGSLGREQGRPLVGLCPAKVCIVIKTHVVIEVLSPDLLEREQGRSPVGLCPTRVLQMVSETSDGSLGSTPCLPMTTIGEHRDRDPARGNTPRGNTANPVREPRAGAGPNPLGCWTRTDSTTHRESEQLRDLRGDAGDTAPPKERPADRLPSSSSST